MELQPVIWFGALLLALVLYVSVVAADFFITRPYLRRWIRRAAPTPDVERILSMESEVARRRPVHLLLITVFALVVTMTLAPVHPLLSLLVVLIITMPLVARFIAVHLHIRRAIHARGGRVISIEALPPWSGPFPDFGLHDVVRKVVYVSDGRERHAWLKTNSLGFSPIWKWDQDDGDYTSLSGSGRPEEPAHSDPQAS